MNKWRLPASLTLGGAVYAIRTDYRVALGIMRYLKKDLPENIKMSIVLKSLYTGADDIPEENIQEAIEKAFWFISGGVEDTTDDDRERPQLVDWEQDADLIISALNKMLGYDIRSVEIHWWTFLSFFREIGDSTFSTVVGIRSKMAHGKKLEDHEREYVRNNRAMVIIGAKSEERRRQDEEDKAALAAIGIK